MNVDAQHVLEDVLEQNKQITLQLAVSRVMIKELQKQIDELTQAAKSQSTED
jgi:hypothetical protein